MAKYFGLEKSLEKKIIGFSYPQIHQLPKGYNKDGEKSIYKISPFVFPSFIPDLNNLPLDPSAKLTDVISCVYITNGFIISDKLKEILSSVELPDHNFFSCSILFRDKVYKNYSWFYFLSDNAHCINFRQSEFYVGLDRSFIEQKVKFSSYEEYLIKYEEFRVNRKILQPYKISFVETPINDLFKITGADQMIYITEKLKEKIEQADITGIEILSNPEVFN